ncbi:MAG: response regulator, partial [Thermoanaerobaculia bacterium]
HASGKDLLNLINDILDLSKIESGTVVVDVGEVQLGDLIDYVERTFRHVAEVKGVEFQLEPGRGVPPTISTDAKRLQQVIKNLLSNAFKFTERGRVSLKVERARDGWGPDVESLDHASSVVAFSVTDTGIGISADKQQIIFEAFQQADGSTSRKYGGTGLGLAISREIARLLGGEIRLTSVPGQGSTFTLYLPQSYAAPKALRATAEEGAQEIVSVMSDVDAVRRPEPTMLDSTEIPDDRSEISLGDRVLLIIDNDENFARFLMDMAHENGFKALVATRGASGIDLAHQYRVDAITLDIQLPFISGWRVLERLKTDLATRHIPVYVITTEEDTNRGVGLGAIGTLTKPIKTKEALDRIFSEIRGFIERPSRRLLCVSPEPAHRELICERVAGDDVEVQAVASSAEALGALDARSFDLVILDALAPFGDGLAAVAEILRQCAARNMPVLVTAQRTLSPEEEDTLVRLTRMTSAKVVQSPERLIDQAALYLHRPVTALATESRRALEALYGSDAALAGKKVLIVDDDIRNIFALTSVLERQNMEVLSAETGQEAIEKLNSTTGIDIVLMDIMMPGMDGYDTMRAIRKIDRFKTLPIIAVTAKAMKGDREKTLQAGAWDYLSKPVDTDQMLSVLRAWLYR